MIRNLRSAQTRLLQSIGSHHPPMKTIMPWTLIHQKPPMMSQARLTTKPVKTLRPTEMLPLRFHHNPMRHQTMLGSRETSCLKTFAAAQIRTNRQLEEFRDVDQRTGKRSKPTTCFQQPLCPRPDPPDGWACTVVTGHERGARSEPHCPAATSFAGLCLKVR